MSRVTEEKVADEFAGANLLHNFAQVCAEGIGGQRISAKLMQKIEVAIFERDTAEK